MATMIEFQKTDTGGMTLTGRVTLYNTPVQIAHNLWEQIMPGAFARSIEADFDHIRLTDLHVQGALRTHQPMGKPIYFDDQPDALYATFKLADTQRARDAKALYDAQVVTGLSAGYDIQQSQHRPYKTGALAITTQAKLDHIAFVTKPAFADAQVLSMKDDQHAEGTSPRIWRFKYPQT